MNTRILSLSAALFGCIGLMAQHKQLSLGVDLALPQGDFSKEYSLGVGPTVGFELPVGTKLGITLHTGYDILLLKEEIKEVLESASLIPIQVGAKYYFMESQKGVYAHAQLGVHMFSEKFKENALFGLESETESSARFSWGIGAGYQLSMLDFGVRYNMILPAEAEAGEEAEPFSYIGLRIAYLISFGK